MKPADNLLDHLLSHRLRGFDRWESTRLGLERGLKVGVRNVEFDVRFTSDRCPIAYHDPFFRTDDRSFGYVDEWSLEALRRQQALAHLATLQDMCVCFAAFRQADALLHVDVKVSGHEEVIYDTLAKSGVLPNSILVSWLPQVLLRFHEISPQTRLCFSHIPLVRAPWLYRGAKAIFPVVERAAPVISRGLREWAPQLANETLTVRLHFHDDGDAASGAADDDGARSTPGHAVPGVLTGAMLELLRKTNGMVCVPVAMATRDLRESYRSLGVAFATYSVADLPSLEDVVGRIDPDIIYVDNADLIRMAAASAQQRDAAAQVRSPQQLRAQMQEYPFT